MQLFTLIEHLCLSGMWLDVGPRTDTKKTFCSNEIGSCPQNLITTLGSIVNLTKETYMPI
jgi:hypothetical protein